MKNFLKRLLGINQLQEKIELLQWQIDNPRKLNIGETYQDFLIVKEVIHSFPLHLVKFQRYYYYEKKESKEERILKGIWSENSFIEYITEQKKHVKQNRKIRERDKFSRI